MVIPATFLVNTCNFTVLIMSNDAFRDLSEEKKKMMHLDSMIIFNGVGIFDFKLIRTIMWGEGGL